MREFSSALTAAEAASRKSYDSDAGWPHTFMLDGREMHYREPTEGEGTMIVLSQASATARMTRMANIIDVVLRVLRVDDRDWLYSRLMDIDDPLSMTFPRILAGENGDDGLLAEIVEVWGGRPTERSSSSSSPPPEAGSGSTRSTPISTYSPSPSASS